MGYKSIFETKVKKENKIKFCKRITELFSGISLYYDYNIYNNGKEIVDTMFKHCAFNEGYSTVNDLLKENNNEYIDIFAIASGIDEEFIEINNILANIEIIANCLYSFKSSSIMYFSDNTIANNHINLIFGAMKSYLLDCGYRFEVDSNTKQCFIVQNEIAVDIDSIKDVNIKEDIINFYDYKNAENMKEKKQIILNIINNLESKRKEIEKIMGKRVSETVSIYANNFHLRHDNISESSTYYKESISNMSTQELINWYNFIFAFMLNIYMNLNVIKNVDIKTILSNNKE